MKNKIKLPFLRTKNLVVKELPKELLIYDLEKDKAFCLNETARLVMNECDGVRTIDEAVGSLNLKLKSNLDEEMVWMVIEQLKKSGLLEEGYDVPLQTTKVTRRKILQTAAALGIALPMITSLVAPTAANAQSNCTGVEGNCIIDADISGCCPNLFCVNVQGETSICLGCIALNSPTNCFSNPSACCPGSTCIQIEPGFGQCNNVIG